MMLTRVWFSWFLKSERLQPSSRRLAHGLFALIRFVTFTVAFLGDFLRIFPVIRSPRGASICIIFYFLTKFFMSDRCYVNFVTAWSIRSYSSCVSFGWNVYFKWEVNISAFFWSLLAQVPSEDLTESLCILCFIQCFICSVESNLFLLFPCQSSISQFPQIVIYNITFQFYCCIV